MTFGAHIEELRRCMVRALVGVGLALLITLLFSKTLIALLSVPLAQAQRAAGQVPGMITVGLPNGFTVYLKVALVTALIIALPWVLYQAWKFVSAGLYPKEQSAVRMLLPFSAALSFAGVMFMYFIMLPVVAWFFVYFSSSYPDFTSEQTPISSWLLPDTAGSAGPPTDTTVPTALLPWPVVWEDPTDPIEKQIWVKMPEREIRVYLEQKISTIRLTSSSMIQTSIDVSSYINFVAALTLGIVIAFQLPLVMLVLGWTGIVERELLANSRRYCLFGCFAAGMLLTPADVPSMILLAVPLYALFEFGLLLMKWVERNREAEDAADEGGDADPTD